MILELKALDDTSKVWIYQAREWLNIEQVGEIRKDLKTFLEQWTSHNAHLYTFGDVFYHRFIAIFVDERYAGASGCSIDKSIHFIENLEDKYKIKLIERTDVAYIEKAENHNDEEGQNIQIIGLNDLKNAYNSGIVNKSTLVFNNLVKTKADFLHSWVVPMGESWHMRFAQ